MGVVVAPLGPASPSTLEAAGAGGRLASAAGNSAPLAGCALLAAFVRLRGKPRCLHDYGDRHGSSCCGCSCRRVAVEVGGCVCRIVCTACATMAAHGAARGTLLMYISLEHSCQRTAEQVMDLQCSPIIYELTCWQDRSLGTHIPAIVASCMRFFPCRTLRWHASTPTCALPRYQHNLFFPSSLKVCWAVEYYLSATNGMTFSAVPYSDILCASNLLPLSTSKYVV